MLDYLFKEVAAASLVSLFDY